MEEKETPLFEEEKKQPKYLTWTMVGLGVLLLITLLLKFSGVAPEITGNVVADPQDDFFSPETNSFKSLDEEPQIMKTDDNENSEETNNLPGETEEDTEKQQQTLTLEEIEVQSDGLTLQSYEISVADTALSLTESSSMTIEDSKSVVKVKPDTSIILKDFSGTLHFENAVLTMEGILTTYDSNTLTIAYDAPEKVKITLKDGTLNIDDILLDIGGIVSGNIALNDVASFTLGKDKLYLKAYQGSLAITLGTESSIALDGTAEQFHAITEELDIQVN